MNTTKFAISNTKKELFIKIGLIALALTAFISFLMFADAMPVFADDPTVNDDPLLEIMSVVLNLIGKVALYAGIIIVIWGAFNIIMALRREDSEAIGKQITTIAVGALLIGFGALKDELLKVILPDYSPE